MTSVRFCNTCLSRLSKPERKLVLKAVDTKGLMMGRAELDGFACGLQLALGLTTELQHYEERSEEALTVLYAMEEDEDEN